VLLWVKVLRPRRPARSAAPDPLGTVGPLPEARQAPDAMRAGGEQGGERP